MAPQAGGPRSSVRCATRLCGLENASRAYDSNEFGVRTTRVLTRVDSSRHDAAAPCTLHGSACMRLRPSRASERGPLVRRDARLLDRGGAPSLEVERRCPRAAIEDGRAAASHAREHTVCGEALA